MLGKLIKNEFKANIHTIGMIYVVAAAAILVMMAAFIVKITWLSALSTVVLIATGLLAVVMTFVSVVSNFKKTLFGGQGYLSFTLPVTSGQLLAAKTITSFCWMFLSYAVALGIFVGVYLYSSAMIGEDIKFALQMMLSMFEGFPSADTIKLAIIFVAFIIFVRIVVLIAQLYFAITLANTRVMQKLGGFAAVVVFFAVFIVMQIIGVLLAQYVPLSVVLTSEGIFYSTQSTMADPLGLSFGLAGTIFNVVCAAGLFFATAKLMNSKVNIK
ncbi:MAG: hypothetical protein IJB16_09460 [Clostridia bacterium]|nr:hypothetical protein [Clostridia bacterium]